MTTAAPPGKEPLTFYLRMRRRFLAGLLVVVPVIIVLWAIRIILNLAVANFGPIVRVYVELLIEPTGPYRGLIPPLVQVISLMIALTFITAVGWLSTFFAVRKVILMGEAVLHKIPFIKFFYSTPKEVISTLMSTQGNSYNRTVLIEYPLPGSWAFAFATAEMQDFADAPVRIAVFMPTTPNPTTGFLMYLKPEQVRDVDIEFEEAIRIIMSGGILSTRKLTSRPYEVGRPALTSDPLNDPMETDEIDATSGER